MMRDMLREMFTTDWRKIDYGRTALLILLILAIFAALWQYAMPEVRTITTTQFKRVPEIHKVETVKRVRIACPDSGIIVLDKQEAAKKLGIDWLQGGDIEKSRDQGSGTGDQENQKAGTDPRSPIPGPLEITATAEIPRSNNGVNVISVIDADTGVSTIVAKEIPAPWFQFRRDAAAGIRYGLNQRLVNTGTVYGRWDFLRVKNVYLSANGDLTTGGDAHLQLGAEYRW
jgi:hypothetical protein